MKDIRISRMTNKELLLLISAIIFACAGFLLSDVLFRLILLCCAVASGGGLYLFIARRLNERHVDDVVASNEITIPEKRSSVVHVDPQSKRLVFDDYSFSFPSDNLDDDDAQEFPSAGFKTSLQPRAIADSAPEVTVIRLEQETPTRALSIQFDITPSDVTSKSAEETKKPGVGHKRKELNISIADLFDFTSDEHHGEPRNEFDWLLHRVLRTIREVVPSYSTVFFWIDNPGGRMIVEAKITESETMATQRKIPLGRDIVSQIAQSGLPEVLTEISPGAELDLLCYYRQPNGVRSFAGVPVYFNRDIVAVLALDAKSEEAFDARTVQVLGHFTKIISGLIRGYTDKYDLHLSARAVRAVEKLRTALPPHIANDEKIARTLLNVAEEIVEWEWACATMFDDNTGDWTLQIGDARRGLPYEGIGRIIDLQRSIVGTVICSGKPMIIGDATNEVRFHPEENAGAGGSFLCLPLSTSLRSYGAICIEHSAKNNFTQHDADMLVILAQTAAAMIESFHLNKMIDEQLMTDERTGIYNRRYLLSRLDEDITRASDLKEQLSFVVFGIDNPRGAAEKAGADSIDPVVASIAKIVSPHTRMYDVLGRYDANTIGVVLAGKTDEDAYLWAEKARKDIASAVLAIGTKKATFTASAGICGARHSATHVDLVNGALQALERAQEIGGNTVMVY